MIDEAQMTDTEAANIILEEIGEVLKKHPSANIGVWLKRSDIKKLVQDAAAMPYQDEFHLGAQIRYGE